MKTTNKGTFWAVQFVTSEWANGNFKTKKEAVEYAQRVNRYSESRTGERLASNVAHYINYEQVKVFHVSTFDH